MVFTMKKNFKFLSIVVSLLLLSSVLLTGCMYAIAADNGEIKDYTLDIPKQDLSEGNSGENSEDNVIDENTPATQISLMEKFQPYVHKSENNVTIFSEEQYATLKSIRAEGKRTALTYDEILFIVHDSINLYFAYDQITLTNANADDILPLRYYSSNPSHVIEPERKGYDEYFDYYSSYNAYKKMIYNIYEIIYYRIYMHDAGFAEVMHYNKWLENKTEHIAGGSEGSNYTEENGYIITANFKMLAIDGSDEGGLENEKKLVEEYKKIARWEKESSTDNGFTYEKKLDLNSKILCTLTNGDSNWIGDFLFCILSPKEEAGDNNPLELIYPTVELRYMNLKKDYCYVAKESLGESKPVFYLNHEDVTVSMNGHTVSSLSVEGMFKEYDGYLHLHFPYGEEGYYYIFHMQDEGYVYSAEESSPLPLEEFDFPDGFVFEKNELIK